MAFDLFSQPQGVTIPISLFGDAAKAGIAAGNALPTQLTSAIEGGIKGFETGQNIALKENQRTIQENAIAQQPVENQIRSEQLERLQQQNEVDALQLQVEKDTQDVEIRQRKAALELQARKAEQVKSDLDNREAINEIITNPDPSVRTSILNSPVFKGIMLNDPQYAEGVLGSIYSDMNPDQRANAFASLNFSKKMELDSRYKKALTSDLDKTIEKVRTDGTLRTIVGNSSWSDVADSVKVFPYGIKQVDPKTGLINPEAADKPPTPGYENKYQVFKNGKDTGYVVDKTQAGILNDFVDTYHAVNPPPPTRPAPPTPPPVATLPGTAAAQKTPTSGETPLELPPDAVSVVQQRGVEAGANAGMFSRALNAIVPSWLGATNLVPTAGLPAKEGESEAVTDIRGALQSSTDTLTSSTLQKFNSGTPEEKEAIRDWAKANGVRLTYNSLKSFYGQKVQNQLGETFQQSFNEGIAARDEATTATNAATKIEAQAAQASRNMTIDQAVRARNQTEEVSRQLGLTPKQTADAQKTVDKISFTPELQNQPSYVKAIAAVESGGNADAVSNTGVRGLMQVTQAVAGQYGLNRNVPEENVLAGKLYTEDLIRDFNGNKELAFAAYNAGPAVVKYAQRLAGGSTDWREVKKHIYKALIRYESAIGVKADQKLKEVYNYPEKVLFNEKLFS